MVKECSLVAVTPWSINPGIASAVPFCSQGSCRVWMLSLFQFVWQLQSPPRSLLSEPGWNALPPVKCLLSSCPKVISHPLSSSIYVASMQKSHFRAAIILLYLSLGCTLRWPILGPCFSLIWGHMILVVISPHWQKSLRTLPPLLPFPIPSVQFSSVQLLSRVQLFATPWIAMRCTPSLPVHHQLPEFTQTHALDQAKLDTSSRYYGLFLLLWCMDYWIFGAPTTLSRSGRTPNERQTPRHPLAMLNAIRLVSFPRKVPSSKDSSSFV